MTGFDDREAETGSSGAGRPRLRAGSGLRRATLAAIASGLLIGQLSGGCMERGEFQCEEAVARLVDCCALPDAGALNCHHIQDSCGEILPDVGLADARCIREASCAELEARGACAWAASVAAGATTPSPGFCGP
jgi:hypothetical protein